MTAIRNFPDAPLRRRATTPWRWQTPDWLLQAWQVLHRHGQKRAAIELETLATQRVTSDPQMARHLREAAAECRRAAVKAPAGSAS